MKWLVGMSLLFWSVQVHGQALPESPLNVTLITDQACADLDTESAFAKELRIRMPDVVLRVGATDASDTWFLNWTPRDDACWLEVRGPENAELQVPNPPAHGDLELAASQVAWILTMSTQEPSEPEDPTEAEQPPPPPPVPVQAEPTAEEPISTAQPPPEVSFDDDDIIEGGVVFTLVPGLSIPSLGARKRVPSVAIELLSPGHFGVRGFELAWLYASAGFVDGMQIGMGATRTQKLDGFQLAFGANIAGQMDGFQLAFGANLADSADGFQLAFGANIADIADLQIAAVNLADEATVQVGLINISETSDFPVGLINIMTSEPVYATAWGGSSGMIVAGVLHGGKHFRYAYVLAGMPDTHTGAQVFGFGLGASLHFDFESVFFDTELYGLQIAEVVTEQNFMVNLRGIIGWQIAERFAVFAGPALVLFWSGAADGLGVQPGYADVSFGDAGAATRWSWVEFQAGVRF